MAGPVLSVAGPVPSVAFLHGMHNISYKQDVLVACPDLHKPGGTMWPWGPMWLQVT